MSKALVGMLRAVLSLETGAFEKGASAAEKRARALRKNMLAMGKSFRNVGAGMTAAITAPIAGLATMATRSADAMIALEQQSRVAGVGVERFKVLSMTAQNFGVEQEKLGDILKDVNDKIGDFMATGAGPMADFFENIAPKVGITKEAFKGLSSEQALGLYVRSLEKAGVSQQEMTFYMEALASDATALLPMFQDNARAIAEMTEKAAALGMVLDGDTIQAARKSRQEFQIIAEVLRTKMQASLASLLPAFTQLAQSLVPVMTMISDKVKAVADWFTKLSPKAQKFVGIAVALAAALGPVVAGLGLFMLAFAPLAVVIGLVSLPLVAVAGGLTVLALAMQRGEGFAGGLGAALRALPLVGVATKAWEAAKSIAEFVRSAGGISAAFISAKAITLEAIGRMGEIWEGFKQVVAGVWLGVKASALEGLSGVVSSVVGIVNKIVGVWVGAKDAIGAAWASLPGAITGPVTSAANAVISGVESSINKAIALINSFVAKMPGKVREFMGWTSIASVSIDRVAVAAEGAGQSIRGAFSEAMARDYIGPVTDGVDALAGNIRATSEAFGEAGRAAIEAATTPLKSVKALGEAQRMLAHKYRDGAAETDAASESAKDLEDALNDAGDAAEDLGGGGARGARKLKEELSAAAKQAQSVGGELANAGRSFLGDLVSNPQGALSGLFSNLKTAAGNALGDAVFNAKGFMAGFAPAAKNIGSGLSTLFAGGAGALGGLGTALSGAMPFIGAGIAAFNLIKNFAKTEKIGEGFKLGISGGQIAGSAYDRERRSTFWGLFKREYDVEKSIPSAMRSGLQSQVAGIQETMRNTFSAIGLSISDSLLRSVRMASRRIKTDGKSEAEVQSAVQEMFQKYSDKIAWVIGRISTASAQALAGVQAALDPIGKTFDLFAKQAAVAGRVNLSVFARAATNLTEIAGGLDALAQKTSAFFEGFFTDAEKLDYMRELVDRTFGKLGLSVPKTDKAFKSLVLSQDLLTAAGREAYAALIEIAPVFDKVTDVLVGQGQALRAAYNLQGSSFATSWQAKLAAEMQNAGRYTPELIAVQNAELSRQTQVLERVEGLLRRQAGTAEDALTLSQLS